MPFFMNIMYMIIIISHVSGSMVCDLEIINIKRTMDRPVPI